MKTITVGMIGSGFAARFHAESLLRVYGVNVRLKAVASIAPDADTYVKAYGIEDFYSDYRDMLRDPEIDIIDIVVPPALHAACILDAAKAGKHIICEKPLTGYFGKADDTAPIGLTVKRDKMLASVKAELAEIREAITRAGVLFMYAENWVYAPSIQKSAEIIRAKRFKQLVFKAEESHSGSHAAHAAQWSQNGGGSLIRMGCHPLSAVLYLKGVEAEARGETILLESVLADTSVMTRHLTEYDRRYIDAKPADVEDWASLNMAFSDGTRAIIQSGDMILGGIRNHLDIYATDGVMLNAISPSNDMTTYFADEDGLDDVYFTEKSQTKAGWQNIFLFESVAQGYLAEMQDFVECAATGRQPLSGLDLACRSMHAVYAAYLSAAENRRVSIE